AVVTSETLLMTDLVHPDPAIWDARSALRLNQGHRVHEFTEELEIRGRMSVGARYVVHAASSPLEEDVAHICTLAMSSYPFDVGTVRRAEVDRCSPRSHVRRACPYTSNARSRWSVCHLSRLDEYVTDRLSVDTDIMTRHVEVLKIEKEHAILRGPFKAHARSELRSDGCRAFQCHTDP
ncbi:MAG TPA: hypothetical protein VIX84_24040, partial [Acidimicrobiales bacterium]